MENQMNNRKEPVRQELKQLKQLHRAESMAWLLFIGVGLMYIFLVLVVTFG